MTARSVLAVLAVAALVLAVAATPTSPMAGETPMAPATNAGTGGLGTGNTDSEPMAATPMTQQGTGLSPAPPVDDTLVAGLVSRYEFELNENTPSDFTNSERTAFLNVLENLMGPNGERLVDDASFAPNGIRQAGKKFTTQDITALVDIRARNAAAVQNLQQAIINAVNDGTFAAAGINVLGVTQVAAPGSPATIPTPSTTNPGAPAAVPSSGTTTGNVDITILGTRAAFTTADQNALTSAAGAAVSGTAVIVNIAETNTNARKFTMQASALRLTTTMSAPANLYPTLASIIARLQTVARLNGGRLGNSSIVSITASDAGSAAGSGPVAMTFLVAILVAMLSAMAQF